jgi:chaperonin cofactor prefoldin
MAVRKKVSDKFTAPLSGIQHKLKQAWREVQSQIGDRLSDFDAWAVEQVNESLEGVGEKFGETIENAKETLQEKYSHVTENLGKKTKKRGKKR